MEGIKPTRVNYYIDRQTGWWSRRGATPTYRGELRVQTGRGRVRRGAEGVEVV